ncbi:hypothetical protein SRB5_64470 [Streptomyces sp. RB5]|uniref:YdhG-like domain-containing protein n=1 Tax=Streptomyces smaragdinus TaxID=2585196 RepID=A0A7K0CS10_9ACTN|nr:DUF1801 domain-containing protein [Streptomyces smaragdinus]MQY16249.1 hypothetical protein [Streptomyces smaragdinus]
MTYDGFTLEERDAMKQRAQELKAAARRTTKAEKAAADAAAVAEKIAGLEPSDRELAERFHEIVTASAPDLAPKLWYGMPAYCNGAGKIVCHFQPAKKFSTRYATIGFADTANLDDGTIWPTSYALTELTEATEATIAALLTRAVS